MKRKIGENEIREEMIIEDQKYMALSFPRDNFFFYNIDSFTFLLLFIFIIKRYFYVLYKSIECFTFSLLFVTKIDKVKVKQICF